MTGRPQDYRYEAAATFRDTYVMPNPRGEGWRGRRGVVTRYPNIFEKETP